MARKTKLPDKQLTKVEVISMIPDIIDKEIWDFLDFGRPRIIVNDEHLLNLFRVYCDWKKTHVMYRPEVIKSGDMCGEIIQVALLRPMGWEEFTQFCNVKYNYFNDMKAKDPNRYALFSSVISAIQDQIRKQKFDGAALNLYNGNIISRDLGLADKSEVNHTIIVEQPGQRMIDDEDDDNDYPASARLADKEAGDIIL